MSTPTAPPDLLNGNRGGSLVVPAPEEDRDRVRLRSNGHGRLDRGCFPFIIVLCLMEERFSDDGLLLWSEGGGAPNSLTRWTSRREIELDVLDRGSFKIGCAPAFHGLPEAETLPQGLVGDGALQRIPAVAKITG